MTDSLKPDYGFLSRWSYLKRGRENPTELDPPQTHSDSPTDTQLLEQVHTNMAGDQAQAISSEFKKQALKAMFRQSEFNHLDGLNDYDEDFTSFSGLGNLVTEQMQRMMRLAEKQKNSDSLASNQQQKSPHTPPTDDQTPQTQVDHDPKQSA